MNKSLTYLFEVYAGSPNLFFWRSLMILAGFMIIVALIGFTQSKNKDKFIKHLFYRLTAWGMFSGLIIFLLAAFRFMNVYLLSMRLWIFVWLFFSAIWILRISKWWFLDVPKARSRRRLNQAFQKYMPR